MTILLPIYLDACLIFPSFFAILCPEALYLFADCLRTTSTSNNNYCTYYYHHCPCRGTELNIFVFVIYFTIQISQWNIPQHQLLSLPTQCHLGDVEQDPSRICAEMGGGMLVATFCMHIHIFEAENTRKMPILLTFPPLVRSIRREPRRGLSHRDSRRRGLGQRKPVLWIHRTDGI